MDLVGSFYMEGKRDKSRNQTMRHFIDSCGGVTKASPSERDQSEGSVTGLKDFAVLRVNRWPQLLKMLQMMQKWAWNVNEVAKHTFLVSHIAGPYNQWYVTKSV